MDRPLRLLALAVLLALAAAAWAEPGVTPEAAADTGPADAASAATARQEQGASGRLGLYDVVRGPAFLAAWVVFGLGMAWRVAQYARLTTRTDRLVPGLRAGRSAAPAARPAGYGFAGRGSRQADLQYLAAGISSPAMLWARLRLRARATILGSNPVMACVSGVFHVLLFLAPLLLPAHTILFDLAFRVSLPALPEPLLDGFTVAVIAACLFFLARRLAVPRVRALTSARDWLVLGLVLVPFLTAFLAYHQLLPYRAILLSHMVVGELVIAAIPFSAIGHMPFIFFARLFTAGEYSVRPGRRVWS